MAFTKNQIKRLEKCSDDKKIIIVSGINSIGQPFDARGFIAHYESAGEEKYEIGHEGFCLSPGQVTEGCMGPILTCLPCYNTYNPEMVRDENEPYIVDIQCFIGSVIEESSNKVLFENPEVMKLIKDKKSEKSTRTYKELCKLIGEPIVSGVHKGIIRGFTKNPDSDCIYELNISNGALTFFRYIYADKEFKAGNFDLLDKYAEGFLAEYSSSSKTNQSQPE